MLFVYSKCPREIYQYCILMRNSACIRDCRDKRQGKLYRSKLISSLHLPMISDSVKCIERNFLSTELTCKSPWEFQWATLHQLLLLSELCMQTPLLALLPPLLEISSEPRVRKSTSVFPIIDFMTSLAIVPQSGYF